MGSISNRLVRADSECRQVWAVFLLMLALSAFVFAGCEETESSCSEPYEGALSALQGTWSGRALVVSQTDVPDLETDVSLRVNEEQCTMQATFRETGFGICGSEFEGELTWDASSELWTGSFVEVSEELTRFTLEFELSSTNGGELDIGIDESTVPICQGNVIEGSLTRR